MLLPTLCLEKVSDSVPVCKPSSSLAAVLEIFSENRCDRIVVIDEQRSPLGIVQLGNLLPYLMASNPGSKRKATQKRQQQHSEILQQPLSSLEPKVIELLSVVPRDLGWDQFWPYLFGQSHGSAPIEAAELTQTYAVVDENQEFLGIVNPQRLLALLASTMAPGTVSRAIAPSASQAEASNSQTDDPPLLLKIIWQLLEQLPLPLMLQTSTGEAIASNPLWQRHFRDNYTPREPAATGGNPSPNSAFPSLSDDQGLPAWTSPLAQDCQFTNDNKTYTCIYPSSNDQDTVWQFIKVPLAFDLEAQPPPQENPTPEEPRPLSSGSHSSWLRSLSQWATITHTQGASVGLWLVLAQDVTEQQQVSKELAAKNADLVQLNRLKDEFLACISHELKTPLTAVLGLSSLLKDQSLGQLNDRQARYAQMIYQSGRHLMSVVNDILDLTRIETDQLQLMLEPVNITHVCDRAFTQAQQQQPAESPITAGNASHSTANPRFELEIEPGLSTLIADELRLRQMLVNLLSNALKFTPGESKIGMRVNRWEGWIAFTVWDTGIGIPDEQQHLIFQKFQQLENPLTRRFEGTGLGLVLTQRLARLHGGDVSFISKAGKGSEFTLLLPPKPPVPRGEQSLSPVNFDWIGNEKIASALGEPPGTSATKLANSLKEQIEPPNRLVLIVEAVPRFIEDLSQQLSGLGYRVAIARSGTEAIEKTRRLQPLMIFLNPLLPQLSGWDVLTLLKSEPRTQHIPVIVMATRVEKERAKQSQAEGFLSLPVQALALQQTLSSLQSLLVNPATQLTVLRLKPSYHAAIPAQELHRSFHPREEMLNSTQQDWHSEELNTVLHLHNYRVLEADDLEQADLLAKVWQPDVVLLDLGAKTHNCYEFIQQLSQHQCLAALPLVTLDAETTLAANQISQTEKPLQVFPCLAVVAPHSWENHSTPLNYSALLQVIQVAAGMSWKPSILVVDVSMLSDLCHLCQGGVESSSAIAPPETISHSAHALNPFRTDWLQALVHYLETGGFCGVIAHSWAEVLRQVECHSVDLLLICLRDSQPPPALVQALRMLGEIPARPPVLVLDQRSDRTNVIRSKQEPLATHADSPTASEIPTTNPEDGIYSQHQLSQVLQSIATEILPPCQSMAELLTQINLTLSGSHTHQSLEVAYSPCFFSTGINTETLKIKG